MCSSDAILPVNTALSQTTVIDVPKGQFVYDVQGGDQNTWEINGDQRNSSTEPLRSVSVMPKVKGATTMLYLTTNTQMQCILRLQEVTGPGPRL
jgi:hypothetical protein